MRILSCTRTFAEQAGHFDVRHQSELCDGTERDHLFQLRPRRRYLRSRDADVVDRSIDALTRPGFPEMTLRMSNVTIANCVPRGMGAQALCCYSD